MQSDNQVWSSGISYVRLEKGLTALNEWQSNSQSKIK
jgi:hypothetical protein